MKQQLELSQHELEAIGFAGHYAPADNVYPIEQPARVWYTIPVTNGEFIYNERGEFKQEGGDQYKWYLKITVGDAANCTWLNIERVEELYMVLSVFKVKYNLVIF